jgi:hypothetical protein
MGQARRAGPNYVSTPSFGGNYAERLAEWCRRFAYCEAGFRTGILDVALYVLGAHYAPG